MITREMLVGVIYRDDHFEVCDDDCNNDFPCEECCERMVTEYEDTIRVDERKKMLEWICHESVYDLLDEHGLNVDSAESIYGWNGKHYEADTINDVLANYEEWLKENK